MACHFLAGHFFIFCYGIFEPARYRRETQELLSADRFDAEAFEDLTQRMYSANEDMRTSMQAVMVDLATSLPDAERQKHFKAGFDRTNLERPHRRPRPDGDRE